MTDELTEVMPQTIEVGEEYRLWLEDVELARSRFITRLKPHIQPDATYVPFRELGKVGLKTEAGTIVYTADTYLIGCYLQHETSFEWFWSWSNPKLKDLGLPMLQQAITESKELGTYGDEMIFEDIKLVDYLTAVAKHYGCFENTEIKENELGHKMVIGWKNIQITDESNEQKK